MPLPAGASYIILSYLRIFSPASTTLDCPTSFSMLKNSLVHKSTVPGLRRHRSRIINSASRPLQLPHIVLTSKSLKNKQCLWYPHPPASFQMGNHGALGYAGVQHKWPMREMAGTRLFSGFSPPLSQYYVFPCILQRLLNEFRCAVQTPFALPPCAAQTFLNLSSRSTSCCLFFHVSFSNS